MHESIFFLIVLLFSMVIHEISHGKIADLLGDPTAKYAGRLTLNPLKHLDFFGSIIFPLFLFILTKGQGPIFGWAKPVPINPCNFRNPKWDNLKTAIAGPAANILIVLFFGLLIRFLPLPASMLFFLKIIIIINLFLAFFNLFPIPPLDGSHILFAFLPEKYSHFKSILEQYGIFLLISVIFLGGLNFLFLLVYKLFLLIVGSPF